MGLQLSDLVEKVVGKEEIAPYEQFPFFPQCFQKLSVVDLSNEYLWSKGLTLSQTSNFRLFQTERVCRLQL